jgi:tetratricopeptide (TPR) repeat protein
MGNQQDFRPEYAASLVSLANQLTEKRRDDEALVAVQEAVEIYQELASADPGAYLPELASAINTLAARQVDLGNLDAAQQLAMRAVEIYQRLADRNPRAHLPSLAQTWHNVAVTRYLLGEDEQAVEAAAESAALIEQAANSRSGVGHLPDLGTALVTLSTLLLRTGRLTEATDTASRAVDTCQRVAASDSGPGPLINLAEALQVLSVSLRESDRYEEAIEAAERAVAIRRTLADAAPGELMADLAPALENLASGFAVLGRERESLAGYREAVDLYRRLAERQPEAALPPLAGALTNLGAQLTAIGRNDEAVAAVEESVNIYRQLAEISSDTYQRHLANALANLGRALWTRYEYHGDPSDLDGAVQVLRESVAVVPADHPDRFAVLSNLGSALETRFSHAGSFADLDEAVSVLRESAAVLPADRSDRPVVLSNLGRVLATRFERTGEFGDLDESIRLSREALAATLYDNPNRPLALSNLGTAFATRFGRTGEFGDADEAIRLLHEAVAATPADHPSRAMTLSNLGRALEAGFQHAGNLAWLGDTIRTLHEAAQDITAPGDTRMAAAIAWARAAASAGDYQAAADGYALAVGLLQVLAWPSSQRIAAERHLADWAGLTVDAAACALYAGRPGQAVQLLEQGRSVLWSHMLRTSIKLSELQRVAPRLADRLSGVREALEFPTAEGYPGTHTTTAPAQAVDTRMRLAREWDSLVEQVRALPGFDRFLAPDSLAQLQSAAVAGPVVVVNVSRYRCDALILTADGGVNVIPLSELTLRGAIEHAAAFLAAIGSAQSGNGHPPTSAAARQNMTATLAWLWDAVTEPVLSALGYSATPPEGTAWPRVWWCPTGPLAFLPLHAAGRYAETVAPFGSKTLATPQTVLDPVVSSYTPTLTALIQARGRPGPTTDPPMLIVGVPDIPGVSHLPGVTGGVEMIMRTFGGTQTVLIGPAATRAAVLHAMGDHSWIHLACHGTHNTSDPTQSALQLYDGQLTVGAILTAQPVPAELAFLSASYTAIGGTEPADEAIHLAAALHTLGYRHVIATLWAISDSHASDIASATYSALTSDGRPNANGAAESLHRAIRGLRASYPNDPTVWAQYVHFGP